MSNPFTGEVSLILDGRPHVAKLTLGALAELETVLGEDTLIGLVTRFEQGSYSARDVLALVVAGLRGGGWQGSASDLRSVEIGGGMIAAARAAAQLLARAFQMPEAT